MFSANSYDLQQSALCNDRTKCYILLMLLSNINNLNDTDDNALPVLYLVYYDRLVFTIRD